MHVLDLLRCECLTLSDRVDERSIADEIAPLLGPQNEIGVGYFITVVLLVLLILLISFPKIFLTAQIYYKSRSISFLEREYKSLQAENRIILNKVEKQRFKNQILDTIF